MVRAFFKNWAAPKNCTDEQVLLWLGEGTEPAESLALDCLFRRMAPEVAAWALKNGGDEDEALTALTDALFKFVGAFRRGKYVHDGRLAAFIMRIAMNAHFDGLRKKGRPGKLTALPDRLAEVPGWLEEEEEKLALAEQEEAVVRRYEGAVLLLDPDCRERLDLFYEKKWRLKAIALHLGIGEGSAKTAIHRCREKLRKLAGLSPEN